VAASTLPQALLAAGAAPSYGRPPAATAARLAWNVVTTSVALLQPPLHGAHLLVPREVVVHCSGSERPAFRSLVEQPYGMKDMVL
jgi:predicted short-subunit dehydrogenase-like oxidoreductase (DUF2520 family)